MGINFSDGTTQTSAAGGKLLQVQTSQVTSSSTLQPDNQLEFKDIPISVSITPSSSSSKILVSFMLFGDEAGNSIAHYFRVKRAISGGSTTFITAADQGNRTGTLFIGGMGNNSTGGSTPTQITMADYVDSPSTTSAITYTIQHTSHGSQRFYLNKTEDTNNQDAREDGISLITVKEVSS